MPLGIQAGAFTAAAGARADRRLRHQSGAHRHAGRRRGSRGGAGAAGQFQLGAPRAHRQPARQLHELRADLRAQPPDRRRQGQRPHRRARTTTRIDLEGRFLRRHRQSRQPEHPGRPRAGCRSSPRSAAPPASASASTASRSPLKGGVDRTRLPGLAPSPTARPSSNDDRNYNQLRAQLRAELRADAGRQAVRRGRRRHAACTTSRSTAPASSATPTAATSRPARPSSSRACSPARSRSAI